MIVPFQFWRKPGAHMGSSTGIEACGAMKLGSAGRRSLPCWRALRYAKLCKELFRIEKWISPGMT
jgi:hypothetical protein